MHQGISRFRRTAIAAAATLATTAGLLPLAATGAGATATFSWTRLAGADRYETAAKTATTTFPAGADNAIIATGENFPDALAGSYAAGQKAAPILLTGQAALPDSTKTALSTLKTKSVWILGGTAAVSQAVEDSLKGMNLTVTRIAGADRYETAQKVATITGGNVGTVGAAGKTAIVATGDKFPDALAAGAAGYGSQLPIILTNGAPSTTLNSSASSALTTLAIKNVIIMGGEAAITTQVENQIKALNSGITTAREAGADRTETARLFAEFARTNLGFGSSHVNLARGDNFPDALAGGPHAGVELAPILLTVSPTVLSNSADTGAKKYLTDHASTLNDGHLLGGTAAISDTVASEAATAAGSTATSSTQGATSLPELQSATVQSANETEGAIVRYCFDEVIDSGSIAGNAALFHIYQGTVPGLAGNGVITLAASDAKCVDVQFNYAAVNSTAKAGALTVATVDAGAVFTGAGATDANPIGDAPLGTTGTTQLSSGTTSAPDLLTVGGFTVDLVNSTPGNAFTKVVFTFDEVATDQGINGYHVIAQIGANATPEDINCTYVSGTGTTAITATCQSTANPDVALSSSNVARGYVEAGTVADNAAGDNPNPIEAADVSSASNSPDLVSISILLHQPALIPGTFEDRLVYTFDEQVQAPGAPGAFHAYTNAGTPTAAATAVERNAADFRQVAAHFPDGALASAVGAYVDAGAVTGVVSNNPNFVDEAPGNAGSTSVTSGFTDGPDLTGVIILAHKDTFGNIDGYYGVYLFDEALNTTSPADPVPGGAPANYKLYAADGTLLQCDAAAVIVSNATPGTTDKAVVCTQYNGSATAAKGGVVGTVDNNTVVAKDAGPSNPEGAAGAVKSGF